jgi:hypothetical protein
VSARLQSFAVGESSGMGPYPHSARKLVRGVNKLTSREIDRGQGPGPHKVRRRAS